MRVQLNIREISLCRFVHPGIGSLILALASLVIGKLIDISIAGSASYALNSSSVLDRALVLLTGGE